MLPRNAFSVVALLTADTFRQARASGISLMMLAVTLLCSLLCLSVKVTGDVALDDPAERVYFLPPVPSESTLAIDPAKARREGVETVRGRISLAFGAVSFPVSRDRADAVRFLETLLGGGIAGTFGLLLALVWTAGFVPTFLDPRAASVLIAKPASRRLLLLGKFAGVLAFVGFQVALFVGLTWTCLGLRTGIWEGAYLGCVPLLLLQFAVFYAFSVLLGVVTRSTVACVFGSVLFWLLSWGINYGSVMAHALPRSQSLPSTTLALTDLAYWVSPKPIDAALILFNTMDAHHHFETPEVFRVQESRPSFSPRLSILSSFLLCSVLLGLSCHEFDETDY